MARTSAAPFVEEVLAASGRLQRLNDVLSTVVQDTLQALPGDNGQHRAKPTVIGAPSSSAASYGGV
jgi:hypothetical protein